jgi:3-hydroxyacyl-[acyl-carrier-protein] dehydratase
MDATAERRIPAGDVRALLRHRPPFLFVDRAEIGEDGTRAWGTHVFSADEAYFEGHFPDEPVVPGVVLLELIAQTANVLLSHRAGRRVNGYLVGVDDARFNRPVRPGDTVVAEVRLGGLRAERIVGFRASVLLDGRRCMRASVGILGT